LGPLGVFPGGDVAVAGGVYGTGSFGPIQVSVDGLLVARCSGADGQPRWLQSWPAPQGALPSVVLTDPLGDIVVAGAYAGPADFGGGPMPQEPGWTAFLARYGGIDGSHRWSLATPAAEPHVQGAFDREGSIVAAGQFFGGSDEHAYVTRLAWNDGAVLWRREFRANNWDLLPSVATGTGVEIVLAGALQAGTDFGGGPMSAGAFVLAWYARDGAFLRARMFERAAQAQGRIAVDPHGDIVIAGWFGGWFGGTIDFGTGQLTVEGESWTYDAFVAKFSGVDGNALWSRQLVDISLANLAIDQRCSILTAGYSPVGVLVSKLAP
ncbi:MAG: hypothetical protein AAB131_16585, partial [Actinomycetota bacterium]